MLVILFLSGIWVKRKERHRKNILKKVAKES